jgi:hypothetical protein
MPAPSDVRFHVDVTDAQLQCTALIPLGASTRFGSRVSLRLAAVHEDVNASRGHDGVKPLLLAKSRAGDPVRIRRLVAAPDFVVGSLAAAIETGGAQQILPDLAYRTPSATNPFLVFNGEQCDRTALLLGEPIAL